MWIIDPIDGTKNFFRRKEDFAISIAYYEDLKPVFGFVYDVVKDDIYLGIANQGAYLNNKRLENLPIRTMNQSVLDMNLKTQYTLEEKYNANVKLVSTQVFAHRNIGSAAISMCHIARGLHDIYISSHLKLWDYAASSIVLKEVGGEVYIPFEDKKELNVKSVFLFATSSKEVYQDLNKLLYGEINAR
jgi:myo-inositol-1(or 4)-monophosphatase